MALTDKKIQGNTPIRDFPDKYNGLIEELVEELEAKDRTITQLRDKITNLERNLNAEKQRIRAEYLAMYDKYTSDLDNKFDAKMAEFERKFVKKTNN